MIPKSILRIIEGIVGQGNLKAHSEQIAEFGSDATKLQAMPDAVAFPRATEEISEILALATKEGFPVIPRGAGSGMSGGAVPVEGGLVLAMSRFNRILSIDEENMVTKVEPGVITADLQQAVEKYGLFYPPDPASMKISTIGGNLAECAGGLRAVKYGVTRDYVLGLTIVLPTGEVLNTGVETMKGVAGYDLTRLIVGSEGTLAVITSSTLKLLPLPEATSTMIAFFKDIPSATAKVTEILRSRVLPSVMELVDNLCLSCIRDEIDLEIPQGAGAMLLLEVDGEEVSVERDAEKIRRVCKGPACIGFVRASGSDEAEGLWEARRGISPSLTKLRPHKISEDIVVPRNKMPQLAQYLNDLSKAFNLPIPVFGHAGDGNLHVNIMLDKDNPSELEKAHLIVTRLFQKVLELGGTITGEHGIGITKKPYLGMEIPTAGLELMSRIKKAFDPAGILNPGKILP
ncbi:MAG: FAD-binding protein [Deltaproteobacteria bacterium]|nr:FAD-binding protein [Deltaproteobacteria bacterium]MBW1927933.1 FAD-binding protein [Deltaproteobacteria bacterium]MBW2024826.1 FAD-binding protein [Deltaproteobacteria bacterium]MBW2124724.1 FAD-binding protein [Deltaproteobacteria bacterium]RLB24170.1 MAG: glycolate oxidase subunit GlcD [Deltaproteobacteria bacterium]